MRRLSTSFAIAAQLACVPHHVAVTSPSLGPSPAATTARRWFLRNLFSSASGGSAKTTSATSDSVKGAAVPKTDPNETLVDSGLELLRLSSSLAIGTEERRCVEELVSLLFACDAPSGSISASAQFDAVYHCLLLEVAHGDQDLEHHLLVVLDAIVPEKLFLIIRDSEDIRKLTDASHIFQVKRVAHMLLGDLTLFGPEVTDIDVDAVFDELTVSIPSLSTLPSFSNLRAASPEMMLRARLFSLVAQLCASFDPENTGRVDYNAFREALERVAGPEKCRDLLGLIKPDEHGKIRYHHVSAALMRQR